jgi:hypothetical protein
LHLQSATTSMVLPSTGSFPAHLTDWFSFNKTWTYINAQASWLRKSPRFQSKSASTLWSRTRPGHPVAIHRGVPTSGTILGQASSQTWAAILSAGATTAQMQSASTT